MIITKSFESESRIGQPTEADLATINKEFALEPLTAEDIYVVTQRLSHDRHDRSHERFPKSYLDRFATTIVGKSLITGHDKSQVPVGRYFEADVVPKSDGSHDLIARAYIHAQDPIVNKIRTGIARDVSIGASVDYRNCDLCDKPYRAKKAAKDRCSHQLGEEYDGKLCTVTWAGDASKVWAREGSIVYLGCLPGATFVKREADSDYVTKAVLPGESQVIDYGADDPPAPQETDMELKEAMDRIEALEKQVTEYEGKKHLIEAGETARKAALAEIQRKYTSLQAEKTGQSIVKALERASFDEITEADKDAQEMYDAKFPPQPMGKPRGQIQLPGDTPANFVRRGDRIGGMV